MLNFPQFIYRKPPTSRLDYSSEEWYDMIVMCAPSAFFWSIEISEILTPKIIIKILYFHLAS